TVLRALEKNPSARFSNCQDLFSALCEAFNTSVELVPDQISIVEPEKETFQPSSPYPTPSPKSKNLFLYIGGVAVFIILIVVISSIRTTPISMVNGIKSEETAILKNKDTPPPRNNGTSSESINTTNVMLETTTLMQATSTKEATSTKPKTPTPRNITATYGSCPGAEPQKVRVGDKAEVCTRKDRLILRSAPPPNNTVEIFRMYPGTELLIIDGPKCYDKATWWKVRVEIGSWVFSNEKFLTTTEYEGWVKEGSDEEDPYFICPVK
ncbi:MAG: hypothetical protein AAGU17_12950, partial [Anaerolineaceae bacterium]